MRRWNSLVWVALAALAAVGAPGVERSRAAGYFNMPGNMMQRTGHGYGAGYHAPLILGPIKFDGWHVRNEVRLPSAPRASCACAGGGDCGQMMETPSMMQGVVPTPAVPSALEDTPTPADGHEVQSSTDVTPKAESRPLFDPPVQP
jgi:hypothetical protein